MNRITGKIAALETSGSITLVSLQTEAEISLHLLLIDTPETAPYLTKGTTVNALFKETEVILAKNTINNIAVPNQIPAHIDHLEHDGFLMRVHLKTALGKLSALVHEPTFRKLQLKPGDKVTALVKMNEIMLRP